MDLVDYDPAVFDGSAPSSANFSGSSASTPSHFVPISAKFGHGLAQARANACPGTAGPALLEALEQFRATPPVAGRAPAPHRPGRLPLRRPPHRRRPGRGRHGLGRRPDRVLIRAASAAGSSRSRPGRRPPARAPAGPVRRRPRRSPSRWRTSSSSSAARSGAPPGRPPVEARVFTARLFWLHAEPLRIGELVPLRLGTQQAEARLIGIQRTLDAVTLESRQRPDDRGEAARGRRGPPAGAPPDRLRPGRPDPGPRALCAHARPPHRRRRRHRLRRRSTIPPTAAEPPRSSQPARPCSGHRGAVIWMTGLSGSGQVDPRPGAGEAAAPRRGSWPTVLDGDMLRTGLSRNLGFTADDRSENLRRAAELALHLADAGVVVIAALISPFRADRAAAAERARERGGAVCGGLRQRAPRRMRAPRSQAALPARPAPARSRSSPGSTPPTSRRSRPISSCAPTRNRRAVGRAPGRTGARASPGRRSRRRSPGANI